MAPLLAATDSKILKDAHRPRDVTPQWRSDHEGNLTGHSGAPGRGAFTIIFRKVHDESIAAAKYHALRCGPTITSGSMPTGLIIGKPIVECRKLTVEKLIESLEGMPPDNVHRPSLATGTLGARRRNGRIRRRQRTVRSAARRSFPITCFSLTLDSLIDSSTKIDHRPMVTHDVPKRRIPARRKEGNGHAWRLGGLRNTRHGSGNVR